MNYTTWHRIKSGTGILLPFGLLFLFISGCALSHKEVMAKDQMERAKNAYAEAKANPNVGTYAPLELQEAGKALQTAEQAKELDDILQRATSRRKRPGLPGPLRWKVGRGNDKLNVKTRVDRKKGNGGGAGGARDTEGKERSGQRRMETGWQGAKRKAPEGKKGKEEGTGTDGEGKAMSAAEQSRIFFGGGRLPRMRRGRDANRQAEQAKSATERKRRRQPRPCRSRPAHQRVRSSKKPRNGGRPDDRGRALSTAKANLPRARTGAWQVGDFLKKNPNGTG